jgi:hypothetical protein
MLLVYDTFYFYYYIFKDFYDVFIPYLDTGGITMNIFVALYTIVAFFLTKGIWMLGAYYLVTKLVPLVRSIDFSIFDKEEDVELTAAEADDWYR